MKDPHDPVRWDASESDASDELRRALAALGDAERPQADALQRVRERVLTVFETPAPRRVRLVHALGGSMGVLALGLALVGGLVAWLRFERNGLESMPLSAAGRAAQELSRPSAPGAGDAPEPERSGPGEHAVAAPNVAGSGAAAVRGAAPRALERDDGASARAKTSRAAARASVRGRDGSMLAELRPGAVNAGDAKLARGHASALKSRSGERSAAAVESGRPRASAMAQGSDNPSAASAAPAVDDVAVGVSNDNPAEHASAAPRVSASHAGVTRPDAPAEGPRQPAADGGNAVLLDEATLLQRARRLSNSDAVQALRVLDEHKRRFPAGMLSPEREVLAIELLRSLSRTQEAERRAREFRRDYPKSVYLSRIQP